MPAVAGMVRARRPPKELLLENEKRYKLYPSLAALGEQSILPEIKNRVELKGGYEKQLGLLRCSDCVEYLISSFNEASDSERKKTVAAWAILRIPAPAMQRNPGRSW